MTTQPLTLTLTIYATLSDCTWTLDSITCSDGTTLKPSPGSSSAEKVFLLTFETGMRNGQAYEQFAVQAKVNGAEANVFLYNQQVPGGASNKIAGWATPHHDREFNFMVANPLVPGGPPLDPKLLIRNLPPPPPEPMTSPALFTELSQLEGANNELLVSAPGLISGCLTRDGANRAVLNIHDEGGSPLGVDGDKLYVTGDSRQLVLGEEEDKTLYWGRGAALSLTVVDNDGLPSLATADGRVLYVHGGTRRCRFEPSGWTSEGWVRANCVVPIASRPSSSTGAP